MWDFQFMKQDFNGISCVTLADYLISAAKETKYELTTGAYEEIETETNAPISKVSD